MQRRQKPSLPDRVKERVLFQLRETQPHIQATEAVQYYEGSAFSVTFIGLNEVNQSKLLRDLHNHFSNNAITVRTRASDKTHSFELTVRVEGASKCCGVPLFWFKLLFVIGMGYLLTGGGGLDLAKSAGINPLIVGVVYYVASMVVLGLHSTL